MATGRGCGPVTSPRSNRLRALRWAARNTPFTRRSLSDLWEKIGPVQGRGRVFKQIVRRELEKRIVQTVQEKAQREAEWQAKLARSTVLRAAVATLAALTVERGDDG